MIITPEKLRVIYAEESIAETPDKMTTKYQVELKRQEERRKC